MKNEEVAKRRSSLAPVILRIQKRRNLKLHKWMLELDGAIDQE